MLGVEARSSLPHDQHDGGNLPGQGQTCHLRSDALGQQRVVELLKRTGLARGHDRRTLQQILQIVIKDSARYGEHSRQVDRDVQRMDDNRKWCRNHKADWDHGRFDIGIYFRHSQEEGKQEERKENR